MKQMMRWLELTGLSLVAILAAGGCKKVAPEEVIVQAPINKVTTIAGSGGVIGGYLDGLGVKSVFYRPSSLVIDITGNIFVADDYNFRIRKITPEGVVSTFAGSGNNGYVDGEGTKAQFSYIEGITIDGSGNLYVSDYGNFVIRKITPSGVVTTYAGNGQAGLVNGPVATSKFQSPTGIGIDKNGNLYVADYSVIRKITPDGMVSNYAGTQNEVIFYQERYDGPANEARFGFILAGLTVDPSGNVYVTDQTRNYIWKVTPAGIASTWAGDGLTAYADFRPYNDGIGLTAQFNYPTGLACDAAGNIYVTDQSGHRIRKVTPESFVSTLAGDGKNGSIDGIKEVSEVSFPAGITASAAGDVYFTETNKIRKVENINNSAAKPINNWNNPKSWGNP